VSGVRSLVSDVWFKSGMLSLKTLSCLKTVLRQVFKGLSLGPGVIESEALGQLVFSDTVACSLE